MRQNTVVGRGDGTGIEVLRGSGVLCDANTVRAVDTGIAVAASGGSVVRDNVLRDLGTGVDAAGSTGAFVCDRNAVVAVRTPYIGLPAGTTGDAA